MDSTKNRGRNKMFMCFRPVDIDDDDGCLVKRKRKDGSGDPVVTFIAVRGGGCGGKESVVIPKILTTLSDDKLKSSSDGDVAGAAFRGKKERHHRSFFRSLKAVFFDTSLVIRSSKSRQNSFRSNSTLSSKTEKLLNSMTEKTTNKESSEAEGLLRINSSRSSSLFSSSTNTTASNSLCSSCSSSITSNSRSLQERKRSFRANSVELKQVNKQTSTKKAIGCHSSNIGLCLLLLCLFVLILWGKICAIFCTSTWLFFVPGRINGVDSPVNEFDSLDFDSDEYKKRVIMEGLLGRNRNRVL